MQNSGKDQRKCSLSHSLLLSVNASSSESTRKSDFLKSLPPLNMNIKLDSLRTHLEAKSLSLLHQYKRTLKVFSQRAKKEVKVKFFKIFFACSLIFFVFAPAFAWCLWTIRARSPRRRPVVGRVEDRQGRCSTGTRARTTAGRACTASRPLR